MIGPRHTVRVSLFILLFISMVPIAHSAPKRPGLGWNACSPSGDQLNRLQSANPGAMDSCRNMAQQAQAQGRSFSFMCDANGNVACCNDSTCVQVGSMAFKPKLPGVRPEQIPGTMQQVPPPPGGKSGVVPAPGSTGVPQVK